MINYEPFWTTMEKRGLTAYQLIYYWGISSNTLRRMRHNEAISTPTLNELCLILDCSVEDIGLSTLFQTNFFRLFFRYCTGV